MFALLDEIGGRLNFTYHVVIPPSDDQYFGAVQSNGKICNFSYCGSLGFQYQFGLEHKFWNAGFSISSLEPKVVNPRKTECFQFSANVFSAIFDLFFVFVQASAVKPGICNLFLSYCFLMLSSKRRLSIPVFQNLCPNPYFWGFQIRVMHWYWKIGEAEFLVYFNRPIEWAKASWLCYHLRGFNKIVNHHVGNHR